MRATGFGGSDEHRAEVRRCMLIWRGVETPCLTCDGSGTKVYANTSLWRGGMGGCMMSRGVCDSCWGSGSASKPWTDIREMERTEKLRVAERARGLLATYAGAHTKLVRPALQELIGELDRLKNGRKPRPQFFYSLCTSLASVFADMIEATKDKEPPCVG